MGLNINLEFDAAAEAAPASFRSAIEEAASILDAAISNPITVNLQIQYGENIDSTSADAGPASGIFVAYSTVRADLIADAAPGDTNFNDLPTGSTIQGQTEVAVWAAQEKLFGILPANGTEIDGTADFGSAIPQDALVGVALHELAHALGRVDYGPQPDIFDFFRFSSPGVRVFSDAIPASAAYFSVDGGNTVIADYGLTSDPSDFLNAPGSNLTPDDPFDEFYTPGSTLQTLTSEDLTQLDVLGFNTVVPSVTVTVHNDASATHGQVINLASLVSISDPGDVGYQTLELWDTNGTAATGQFVVNGVAQTGGHEIDVSPANVANTVFDVGTLGGSDLLAARILENNGTFTTWQTFSVTAPAAILPSVTATSKANATAGQVISLASLLAIADPDGVGYQTLELWDTDGTAAGGQFVINGVAQTGGHEIDVSPANVANTVFDAPTLGGTDLLAVRLLEDNGTLTTWQTFSVTVPLPTLTPPPISVNSATAGEVISLKSLVTISDPGNVGYQALELWDTDGTAAGGQFVINGVAQTGGHIIEVSPANVANTVFDAPTLGGTDLLAARLLEDNGTLTTWQTFSVTVPLPTATAVNDSSATRGQVINLASLVSISDPGDVGYQALELWDTNGTASTGQFVVNGVAQTGGHIIEVSPANVADTVFDAPTLGGTDMLAVRLLEDNGTFTTWQTFSVTAPSLTQSQSAASGLLAGASSMSNGSLFPFDPLGGGGLGMAGTLLNPQSLTNKTFG